MTVVLPLSEALRGELRALPEARKRELKVRRHPNGSSLCIVTSTTFWADGVARQLVERYGEAKWRRDRWVLERPQLRLPGM